MSQKNSRIVLSKNIKLDKTYKQVLSYNETNMIGLLTDTNNTVYYANDYSFIRDRGSIKVNASYSTCIQANYMAFQNVDWNGKWFFAFIDKINYLSDNATEIYYTIDEFATWFDYWDPKSCFVVRQHATSDSIGANTVPEKLEHGEYVVNGTNYYGESIFSSYAYLVVLSNPLEAIQVEDHYINMGGTIMNGYVYYCATPSDVDYVTYQAVSHQPEQIDILYTYMIPSILIPNNAIQGNRHLMLSWNTPYNLEKKVLSRPTTIDGYTPINKKLLCYPYQYCIMNNLSGSSNILYFEDSGKLSGVSGLENGAIYVQYYGVPSIGASVIAIPKYYKNNVLSMLDSVILGKYPTLGWSEDAYTNWLSQNAVNNTLNWVKTGIQIVGGVALTAGGVALTATGAGAGVGTGMVMSGIGMTASGGVNAFDTATEYYKHELEPDSYKGNINAGDILTSIGAMGFQYLGMCIKREWAEKIDSFFTRYGYAQNSVQYPNMTHRENYNYIQIAKDENIGYPNNHNNICLPASSMMLINNIFRQGVTVWNNHSNFGNYSVSNNITN